MDHPVEVAEVENAQDEVNRVPREARRHATKMDPHLKRELALPGVVLRAEDSAHRVVGLVADLEEDLAEAPADPEG